MILGERVFVPRAVMAEDIYFSNLQERHLYDGLEEDICTGEELLIPGPAGDLETLTSCPASWENHRPIAVICHPHPLYGGSMKNKVVHILANTFNDMGLLSVTFNFRGVGKSRGRFAHGEGEVEDLLSVVKYLRERYDDAPIWLAGFSFGAFVAFQGHQRAHVERLLLVAPPVSMFEFSQGIHVKVPWMVIQGGKDEITFAPDVSKWVHRQANRPEYHWMAEADHFFHGRLNRIRDAVTASWMEAARAFDI